MIRRLAILLLLAGPVAAQSPGDAAAQAAARLTAARAQLDAANGARDRVAALTETVRAYEDGLIALRDGLRRAAVRESQIAAELAAKEVEIGQLLGVLQAMGRNPAPVLLLHPQGALGTARGGMIAADVAPALQAEADILARQLQEVAELRQLQDGAARTLSEGLTGAQEARTQLAEAISNRTDLPRRFTEDPVQTALLIASSETLDAFAGGLAQSLPQAADTGTDVAGRGDLPLPVRGRLLRGFNEPDAAGVVRPGVILAARPRALVTTPVPATLLFRGPLLDYGNVVILEPRADVMVILAGLAEVYGNAGDVLDAGAAVGLLGGVAGDSDGAETGEIDGNVTVRDASRGDARSETLYLEVREGQTPVDPAGWFALD